MRNGKWELQVLDDQGQQQPEHTVDGRAVVEARPGVKFIVRAVSHGGDMYQVELFLDGKSVSGRKCIDGAGTTTFASSQVDFTGWKKSEGGAQVVSDFVYEQSSSADGDEDAGGGIASAPADWTRGVITLRVHSGVQRVVQSDTHSADHNPDLTRTEALSEKAMVKGGHSASAAAGSKSFSTAYTWRAGQSFVAPAPGDPLEQEMSLYYRDSFFLLLRGDASKVADTPVASSDAGYSDGVAKARIGARRVIETQKNLKRKVAETIDLTEDD